MRLQFDRFRGFVEEYSANLSLGGMFIRTDEPAPVGTEMPIEFRLGHDYELIKGRGRVVWARREAVDDEHPAGMGIRFLELTPGSRELIFKLVERRVREGGDLFDLEHEADLLPERPPEPGPAPEQVVEASLEVEEPLPEASFDGVLGTAGGVAAVGEAAPERAAAGGAGSSWTADPNDDTVPGRGTARRVASDGGSPESRAPGSTAPAKEAAAAESAASAAAGASGAGGTTPPASGEWPAGGDDDASWPVLELEDGFEADAPGGEGAPAEPRGAGDSLEGTHPGTGPAAAAASEAAAPGVSEPAPSEPAPLGLASLESGQLEAAQPDTAASADGLQPEAAATSESFAELAEDLVEGGGPAFGADTDPGEAVRWQDPLDDEAEGPGGAPEEDEPLAVPVPEIAMDGPPIDEPPGSYPAAYAGVADEPAPRRRWLVWSLAVVAVVVLAGGGWWYAAGRNGGDRQAPGPRFLTAGERAADASETAGSAAREAGDDAAATAPEKGAAATPRTATGDDSGTAPADLPASETGSASRSGDTRSGPGSDARSGSRPGAAAAAGAADPAANPSAAPTAAPTAIREITWSESPGRTVLTVSADGSLTRSAVSDFRIGGDSPRHVLRIRGIDQPFSPARLEVGTAQVRQVRAGLHAERSPSELHLVLDLAGPNVQVTSLEAVGGRLRIVVEGGR